MEFQYPEAGFRKRLIDCFVLGETRSRDQDFLFTRGTTNGYTGSIEKRGIGVFLK
jgi:hypothetical protein